MQLLFPQDGNAGIAIKANGVAYVYNYDPQGSWKARNYIERTGRPLEPLSQLKSRPAFFFAGNRPAPR